MFAKYQWLFLWLLLFSNSRLLRAGPAPYSSAKIYILASDDPSPTDKNGKPSEPTAQYIRDNASTVIDVNEWRIRRWFDSLHWENSQNDPEIAKKARPLVMVIDLYDRVQKDPPAKPEFDTLYCTKTYAYSNEGDFIDISNFTSKMREFPLYVRFK
jgi:hypothetical protein